MAATTIYTAPGQQPTIEQTANGIYTAGRVNAVRPSRKAGATDQIIIEVEGEKDIVCDMSDGITINNDGTPTVLSGTQKQYIAAMKAVLFPNVGSDTPTLTEVLTEDNDAGGLAIKNLDDPTDPQDADTLAARQEVTGDLTDLDTTDKTNLVAAINEVAGSVGGGGASLPYTEYLAKFTKVAGVDPVIAFANNGLGGTITLADAGSADCTFLVNSSGTPFATAGKVIVSYYLVNDDGSTYYDAAVQVTTSAQIFMNVQGSATVLGDTAALLYCWISVKVYS